MRPPMRTDGHEPRAGPGGHLGTRPTWPWLLFLFLPFACGPAAHSDRSEVGYDEAVWVSEPDFMIGDSESGPASFSWVPYLRIDSTGSRVLVVEPNISRVTIWTPAGGLLLDVGRRGEGPGEFVNPHRVHLAPSSFRVRDRQRFTDLSYTGEVLATVPNPPTTASYRGFSIDVRAHLPDGSYLGVPSVPGRAVLGVDGDDPVDRLPVLRIQNTGEDWLTQRIFTLNKRNETIAIRYNSERPPLMTAQFLSDADLHEIDLAAGTLIVARRNVGPGQTDILEVSAYGDTLWYRRQALEPLEITRAALNEQIDRYVRLTESFPGSSLPRAAIRRSVVEAMYVPESGFLPSVLTIQISSSGHVWLRTREVSDTLRTWYSFPRGDVASPARKVLLPTWLTVMDASDTHVWGVWRDALDIPYVVGRRLLPQD